MNTTASFLPENDERVDHIEFTTSDDLRLYFRRGASVPRNARPVLIIHGGSASGDTFLQPRGHSLFDYLVARGMDVWLLEWSGSHYIADQQPDRANRTMDRAARIDLAEAVQFVIERTGTEQVSIVAHCMGAACLSMAIGAGHVRREQIHKVVLATIGLFYEVAWDGWGKTQDGLLDRLAAHDPPAKISPATTPWPPMLEHLFGLWPATWGSVWHDEEFFQRLAFMFGQPFLPSNLHPCMTRELVRQQFGSFSFRLFQHAAQNTLRGFAGVFEAEGKVDPKLQNDQIRGRLAEPYLQLDRFRGLEVTLLTGGQNPLWHRDSIDRMAEWLARRGRPAAKHVLPGYGHQDLWWGQASETQVFPLIHEAVR